MTQMSMFKKSRGRNAKQNGGFVKVTSHTPAASYANRGMSFEKALEYMHALYARQGRALVNKQYVPSLLVKDGTWAKVIGRSTVDYVGTLAGGRFVAFDAKDCTQKRIELSRLQDHQRDYLTHVDELGGIAFVLVRFESHEFNNSSVYAIPIWAWNAAVESRRKQTPIKIGEWTTTMKASINEHDIPQAWKVVNYNWVDVVH